MGRLLASVGGEAPESRADVAAAGISGGKISIPARLPRAVSTPCAGLPDSSPPAGWSAIASRARTPLWLDLVPADSELLLAPSSAGRAVAWVPTGRFATTRRPRIFEGVGGWRAVGGVALGDPLGAFSREAPAEGGGGVDGAEGWEGPIGPREVDDSAIERCGAAAEIRLTRTARPYPFPTGVGRITTMTPKRMHIPA